MSETSRTMVSEVMSPSKLATPVTNVDQGLGRFAGSLRLERPRVGMAGLLDHDRVLPHQRTTCVRLWLARNGHTGVPM
jgi:hypothetical protein